MATREQAPQGRAPPGPQWYHRHTTANHPLYDPSLHQWRTAASLKKGEHLQTPDGTLAVADGGNTPKDHDGNMWDLTVPGNNDHDFYILPAAQVQVAITVTADPGLATATLRAYHVEADTTPVLVHNANGPNCEEAPATVRMRHYTNSKGASGIQSSGVIKASDQNKVFMVQARGKLMSPRDAESTLGIGRVAETRF